MPALIRPRLRVRRRKARGRMGPAPPAWGETRLRRSAALQLQQGNALPRTGPHPCPTAANLQGRALTTSLRPLLRTCVKLRFVKASPLQSELKVGGGGYLWRPEGRAVSFSEGVTRLGNAGPLLGPARRSKEASAIQPRCSLKFFYHTLIYDLSAFLSGNAGIAFSVQPESVKSLLWYYVHCKSASFVSPMRRDSRS